MEDLLKVAKDHLEASKSITLEGTVKQLLGTCLMLGTAVEGKSPKEWNAAIVNKTFQVNTLENDQ